MKRGVALTLPAQSNVRTKLEEMGVDIKILRFIDTLTKEDQQAIYHFFLEIMNDELIFILTLKDQDFTEEYIRQREKEQSVILN